MRSVVTVTTAPEYTALTTLERVKSELGITTDEADAILTTKINEASSDIEAQLGRVLSRAGITERIWGGEGWSEYFVLRRRPVVSITSVTVDDDLVDADEYRLDDETGQLYRLDSSGYPCSWHWCKDVVIVYTAGYKMPEDDSPTLPASLEGAAVDLVSSYWQARGRDPLVKAEDIPGLGSVQYWVGAVGEAGELPPSVMSKIAPYRRVAL